MGLFAAMQNLIFAEVSFFFGSGMELLKRGASEN